jgi:hypothetical protein
VGPSTAQQKKPNEDSEDEREQGPPRKRQRLEGSKENSKLVPAKHRLTVRARAEQITLTLDSGVEVKGFDMTRL